MEFDLGKGTNTFKNTFIVYSTEDAVQLQRHQFNNNKVIKKCLVCSENKHTALYV